jgi:hypothetical protein
MFRSNPVLWPKPPVIWSLGIAVLSVATALILTQLRALHLEAAPVSLFLFAVMFSELHRDCSRRPSPLSLSIIISCLQCIR